MYTLIEQSDICNTEQSSPKKTVTCAFPDICFWNERTYVLKIN